MRALLVPLVAAAAFVIGVLLADNPRPGDPLDASPPPHLIDDVAEFLDEQIALD